MFHFKAWLKIYLSTAIMNSDKNIACMGCNCLQFECYTHVATKPILFVLSS